MAREEACSEGGGGVPDNLILGATTFDDQLGSEEVVLTFFVRVGVQIGLLAVTMESICSGEIGTRHWTSEQGVAPVVAAEERSHGNLEPLLQGCRNRKGVQDGRAWFFDRRTIFNLGPWIFLLTIPYMSIRN
jgi:hypothetical protein